MLKMGLRRRYKTTTALEILVAQASRKPWSWPMQGPYYRGSSKFVVCWGKGKTANFETANIKEWL